MRAAFAVFLTCVAPLSAANNYATLVTNEPSLVGFWRMGESSGNFADSSPSGATAIAHGGITYSSTAPIVSDSTTSVTLNGSTGFADVTTTAPFAFQRTSPFTIEANIRANVTSGSSLEYSIFSKLLHSGNFPGYDFQLAGTASAFKLQFYMVNTYPTNWIQKTGSINIPNNQWVYVALTYDGSSTAAGVKIYVDGYLDGNATVAANTLSASILNAAEPNIGARNNANLFFPGKIGDVAVYNVALPPSIIQAHALRSVLPQPTSAQPITVLYDSDPGNDIDDINDAVTMYFLQQHGYMTIPAATISDEITYGAACEDVMLRYAGLGNVTIGAYYGSAVTTTDNYCSGTASQFLSTRQGRTSYTEAYLVMRQALHNAPDGSVYMLGSGFVTNFLALLNSPADGIDARTGAALISAKVAKTVFVMGCYPSSAANCSGGAPEYNFALDPAESISVIDGPNGSVGPWPVPITFAGIEMGNTVQAGYFLNTFVPATNPLRYAHNLYGSQERYFWSVFGMLDMLFESAYFTVSASGTNTITPVTGANAWSSGVASGHYYLTKTLDDHQYQRIEDIILYYGDNYIRNPASVPPVKF